MEVGWGVDRLSLWTRDDFLPPLTPPLLPQMELTHIFILSLNFVSRGRCPFFANLQRIKKEREREEMSQALSADPSALCKLEQRDCFPLIFFGKLSGGGGGWGRAAEGSSWATGEAQDVDERNSREGFVKEVERSNEAAR